MILYAYGVTGWEHIPAAEACRALIVFNHVSYVDGIALVSIFLPSGLANTSVAKMPFVGALTKVRASPCFWPPPAFPSPPSYMST